MQFYLAIMHLILISTFIAGNWHFYRNEKNWYDLSFIGFNLIFLYGFSGFLLSLETGHSYLGFEISSMSLMTGGIVITISMLISLLEFKKVMLPSRMKIKPSFQVVLLVWSALFLLNLSEMNVSSLTSYGDRVLNYNVAKRGANTSGLFEVLRILKVSSFFLYGKLFRNFFGRKLGRILLIPESLILVQLFLLGDRALLIHILILFIFLNRRKLEISFLKGIVYSALGFVAFTVIGIVRVSSNPLEMIKVFSDYLSKNGVKFLSLSSHGELSAGSNMFELIERLNGAEQLLYGKNMTSSISTFFPRFLYRSNESLFGNERFVKEFYYYDWSMGRGHGYFFAMDGFWDAHIVGVIILMLIWKFILSQFELNPSVNSRVWYALALSGLVVFAIRSGFYASIKQWLIYSIFMILYELKLMLFKK